jgi:hypothetical protein
MDAWPSTLAVACGDVESGFVHHDDSVLHQCSKKAVAGVEVRRRLPERWAVNASPAQLSPLVVNNERPSSGDHFVLLAQFID